VTAPVVLAVGHGSRDPAAARSIRALARLAGRLAAGADIRAAFVQHAYPLLADALPAATAAAGRHRTVIVPLLLSRGYHLSQDIAGAAAAAGVAVAAPLGPGARLVPALADRLDQARVPGGTPVVLAAAGSRDPRAAADAQQQAALLAAHLRAPVMAAYAAAARPTVEEAVAALAARTGRPVAVASYLLAPGIFHDRLGRSGAAWVSGPLGDHPAVARLVAARCAAARGAARGSRAA
jgi:sirohydrochlorin ferrochelatase